MGLARDVQDRRPGRSPALQELVAEPALPDPGLAHDPDHLPVAGERPLAGPLQRAQLVLAADEAREAARPRGVEPSPPRAEAGELMHAQRPAHALDLQLAEVPQGHLAGHERRRALGEVDRARGGELLHPLRQPHRVPERGPRGAAVLADRADDDLARVEPHPHAELEPLTASQLRRVGGQLALQVERRQAGAPRVVLVRHRRPEDRHDAVAGELVDRALEAPDARGEDGEEPVHDQLPRLGVELLGQLHRAADVGEQDRDLLALAVPDGGRRTTGRRRRGERRAAAVAEPRARRLRRAARGARDGGGQRCGARGAEARAVPVAMAAGRAEHGRDPGVPGPTLPQGAEPRRRSPAGAAPRRRGQPTRLIQDVRNAREYGVSSRW